MRKVTANQPSDRWIFLFFIICISFMAGSNVAAEYRKYENVNSFSKTLPETPQNLVIEFNSDNSCFLFLTTEQDSNSLLSYYRISDGNDELEGPFPLGTLTGSCNGLTVAGSSDNKIHLTWRDSSHKLWYSFFFMDAISEPVMPEIGNHSVETDPKIDIDDAGEVHIGFSGGKNDVIYIRTVDGEFTASEKIVFEFQFDRVIPMDLAVGLNGKIHFIGITGDYLLQLWFHDGNTFGSPSPIPNTVSDITRKKPWLLVDNSGKISLFYEGYKSRAGGFSTKQLFYQEGNLDFEFSDPELVNHDAFTYEWLEPHIDGEGIVHIYGIRYFRYPYPHPFQDGFVGCHYFKNGMSFGNAEMYTRPIYRWSSSLNYPLAFAIGSDDRLGSFVYDEETSLLGIGWARTSGCDRLTIEIEVTPSYWWYLDYRDLIFIDLSFINPTPNSIPVDMYIIFEYYNGWGPKEYFFLSDQPHYPSLIPEPYAFSFVLESGMWFQHLPLLSVDMSSLGANGGEDFTGTFRAAFIDPSTGELLVNYSLCTFDYESYGDW